MPAVAPFNYMGTVNAAGAFTVENNGVVQGTFYDDPATRWAMRSGILADAETIPMWGGVGIYELIPSGASGTPMEQLGSIIGRATTIDQTSATGLVGFSVFNQAHHMVSTPQSPVPLAGSGMSVHYVRLGSGNRIALACDPSLASLELGSVGQLVSWDFNAQRLQAYDASTPTYAFTSLTWANTNGGRLTAVGAVPQPVGGVGDAVTISGATNTGTGGVAAINRTFIVDTFTDNQHYTLAAPAAAGVLGTIGGAPVLTEGTGILPVRVDRILPGNSMIVAYDPFNNRAVWNYNGTCAVVTV
jgi:hypothetical protein